MMNTPHFGVVIAIVTMLTTLWGALVGFTWCHFEKCKESSYCAEYDKTRNKPEYTLPVDSTVGVSNGVLYPENIGDDQYRPRLDIWWGNILSPSDIDVYYESRNVREMS